MNVVAWAPMMTTPQVEDDVLEGYRVQGDAIAYDPNSVIVTLCSRYGAPRAPLLVVYSS
jgi:hypothetical protein